MRQAARLGRTPWALFVLTLGISLLMCAIGGLAASGEVSPAGIGAALFQVFFSLAYHVVVLIGPAVAANSIAAEREGRTWESLLMTGLTPQLIARGKFLASYTIVALYIVVLAPAGALSFLFGGVTAIQVVMAFALLFVCAALSVAFGLAVSSLMSSVRGALLITLMLAVTIGPFLYVCGGVAASVAIHRVWHEIPSAYPIWLPVAYERAPFAVTYVLYLIVIPAVCLVVPAWFLYEITVANLGSPSDDRSTGLKRWFFLTTPLVFLATTAPCLLASENEGRATLGVVALVLTSAEMVFCALLFAAEPFTPSRRVQVQWERTGAGLVTRLLGPGLTRTMMSVLAVGVVCILGSGAVAAAGVAYGGSPFKRSAYIGELLTLATWSAFFFVFLTGLIAWLRARGGTAWTVRFVVSFVMLVIAAGPWVLAAVAGAFTPGQRDRWLVLASPSPLYAIYMTSLIDRGRELTARPMVVGFGAATFWAALGIALMSDAARRCSAWMVQRDAALAHSERAAS